ncbi:pilin glycosylation ligase domain-containing protein, partial [Acinetobacter venetianus]|uniref:pilin glycosylation ligase domain-containing protein n=1 Tax=Acinetobacter venetianus TaxID=52133 RepID=UPI000AA9A52E
MYINIHKILSPNTLLIKKSLIFFVIFFFVCSILNSEHNLPWVSYTSEKYCFISFAFLCCYFLISSQKILLPIIIIPIGLMVFIPVIQYLFGVIVFFETMFFSSMYLFCFFCSVLIGYNFNDRLLFSRLVCNMFLFVGVISSCIVIIQWLDFYNLQPYIIKIQTDRPYANLGQPNQLSTILIISLCSLWYLYEYGNKRIYNYIALLLLFSIVL